MSDKGERVVMPAFEKYHLERPLVAKYFMFLVDKLIADGHRRISGNWIAGTIRVKFFNRIRKEQYTLPNAYVAAYARMWRAMQSFPETQLFLPIEKSKHFDDVPDEHWRELAKVALSCPWPGRPKTMKEQEQSSLFGAIDAQVINLTTGELI